MGVQKLKMEQNNKAAKIQKVYQGLMKSCKKNKLNFTEVLDKLNEFSDSSEDDTMSTASTDSNMTIKSQKRCGDPQISNNSKKKVNSNDIVCQNRFNVFNKQIDEELKNCEPLHNIQDDCSRKAVRKDTINTNKENIHEQAELNEPKNPTPRGKVPPIMVTSVKTYNLAQALKDKNVKFSVKITKNENQVIRCEDMEGHREMFTLLKENKIEGHTYTPKAEKRGIVILKGVHHSYPAEEIEADIKHLSGLDTKVRNYHTQRSSKEGYKLNMHVVTTDNADHIGELTKLSYICHHKVSWEKQRNNEIVQCLRCQRYGHIAKNCAYHYRCVKCNMPHEPYKCDAPKKDSNSGNTQKSLYCANCQQFGHPANYRGCDMLKQLKQKVQIARQNKQQQAQNKWSAKMFAIESASRAQVRPGLSYAKVTSSSGSQQQPPVEKNQASQSSFDFITTECQDLFKLTFLDLLKKINDFVPQYKDIVNKIDKQSALINFMFGLCLN